MKKRASTKQDDDDEFNLGADGSDDDEEIIETRKPSRRSSSARKKGFVVDDDDDDDEEVVKPKRTKSLPKKKPSKVALSKSVSVLSSSTGSVVDASLLQELKDVAPEKKRAPTTAVLLEKPEEAERKEEEVKTQLDVVALVFVC
jgi:hypothetical protein